LKKWGKRVGLVLGVVLLAFGAFFGWAKWKVKGRMSAVYAIEGRELPVPFPLTEEEVAALRAERLAAMEAEADEIAEPENEAGSEAEAPGLASDGEAEPQEPPDPLAGVDLGAIALERAIARGEHMVGSVYACLECHGDDFAGGTMIDDGAIGSILGPNLTSGAGGVVAEYKVADWDRAVRHGIRPDGTALAMPSEDFQRMSDRELSDIIAYIRSVAPVDAEVPPVSLGPIGTFLVALGELRLSADHIDHDYAHPEYPPAEAPTAEYGEHLIAICRGCHGSELAGGPVVGGDPDWPPAGNLTALQSWEYEDFVTAMRELELPDGRTMGKPMSQLQRFARNMKDVELEAMWVYLETLEALPTPGE